MEAERSPAAGETGPAQVRGTWRTTVGITALLALGATAFPALRWQSVESARTRCTSNERRLATALLLYSQDHDGRLPPPEYQAANGEWRNWAGILQPYYAPDAITVCPSNHADGARNPLISYAYPHSYALNERFYGVFSAGPFPVENLELPAQTVMVAESGGFRAEGLAPQSSQLWSVPVYTDTAKWPTAFPSPHGGRMNVAAADGHILSIKVAHYKSEGHDSLFGRLGDSIYNWNGGHPNGDTGGPPRE